MKIIAVVPIKHNSNRIIGKNYRLMNGRPLYYYILNTLSQVNQINQIVVDTNSPIVKNGIITNFPNIIIYDRPQELSDSNISTNVLLINVISKLKLNADIYLHTHTTNPLLSATTINNCITYMLNNYNLYDSLFTVNKLHTRLYNKNGTPINHDINKLIPTQDLDPIFEENSCLYLIKNNKLIEKSRRIGDKPYMYVISRLEAQDIDWEEDFIITELMMKSI